MILSDDEIQERIESPLNLLNRLKTSLHKTSPIDTTRHPALPPSASDIVIDLEEKIKNAGARSKANNIMIAAMTQLENRIAEVQKPETLSRIAHEMSRVVASHDAKPNSDNKIGQIIIYAPQVQKLENFEIIDVVE